jgi:tRNA-dihydrouridine synthase
MEGVADSAFRQAVATWGKPEVFFTEFTSVDGLYSKGEAYVAQRLFFNETEKPLVAQIWGMEASNYRKAGEELVGRGFDGVDINMGCPDRAVVAKGACSALVKNPELAVSFIRALKEGVQGQVPVSVKIRIGYDKIVTEEWAERLLNEGIDALIVHGRTTKQLSKVSADWEEIGKVVKLRDAMGVRTRVIGNGDVSNLVEAQNKVDRYGVDGVMIGRGIFEDPLVFNKARHFGDLEVHEKIRLLVTHIRFFESTWQGTKPFAVMRKYFKIYIRGFRGAVKLRELLMAAETSSQVWEIINLSGYVLPKHEEYVYA